MLSVSQGKVIAKSLVTKGTGIRQTLSVCQCEMTAKSLIMGNRTTLLVYQGKMTAESLVTKGN